MAKKFRIATANTFDAEVTIPRVGGEPLLVPFTFKIMGRRELAKLLESWEKAAEEVVKELKEKDDELSYSDSVEVMIGLERTKIKDVVVGWAFEDEFNDDNIDQLINTSVGVADEIMKVYNEKYEKIRLGN